MKKESCLICQIVDGKVPSFKIFEDEKTVAILDLNGANPGHCFVIPKGHYPILEQVPDEELAQLFLLANKVSVALFDHAGAEGTNIFVANGLPAGQTVAHFMVHVIPRKQNDGLNLQWQPKQLAEDEASTIELKLKDELRGSAVTRASTAARKPSKPHTAINSSSWDGDDDEIIMQIRRIP